MAAKRKLFIAHAGELAHRLAQAAGPGGLIATFVRSYAERHNRPGLLGDSTHLREMQSTIGREALLVMGVEIERVVPDAFVARRRGAPHPEDVALAATFFREFLESLARAWEWPLAEAAEERRAFDRDLEMYRRWSGRPGQRGRSQAGVESPFADRCALLLDPSMMEQARRAASLFERDLGRYAVQLFGRLGRHAIRPARAPQRARIASHKTRRSRRRASKTQPQRKPGPTARRPRKR